MLLGPSDATDAPGAPDATDAPGATDATDAPASAAGPDPTIADATADAGDQSAPSVAPGDTLPMTVVNIAIDGLGQGGTSGTTAPSGGTEGSVAPEVADDTGVPKTVVVSIYLYHVQMLLLNFSTFRITIAISIQNQHKCSFLTDISVKNT